MERLLNSAERPNRISISVAELLDAQNNRDPHFWYDPRTMPAVANALSNTLTTLDPANAEHYERRRNSYVAALAPLNAKISAIRQRFAGTAITATEPVFGYMADALGLEMTNDAFQTAIMNETEPSARAIAKIIDDITSGSIKVLIYNVQVGNAMTNQLLAIAEEANVPIVGISERPLQGVAYITWMMDQLDQLENALVGRPS